MASEHRSNVVEVYVRYLREKIDRPFGVDVAGDGARRRLPVARGRWSGMSRLPIRVRLDRRLRGCDDPGAGRRRHLRLPAARGRSRPRRSTTPLERAWTQLIAAARRRATGAARGGGRAGESDEGFAQVIGPDGRLIDGVRRVGRPRADRGRARAGAREPYTCRAGGRGGGRKRRGSSPGRSASPAGPRPASYVDRPLDRGPRGDPRRRWSLRSPIGGPARGLDRLAARPRPRGLGAAADRGHAARAPPASRSSRTTPLLPLPEANDEVRRLGETLNEMLERLRTAVRARAALRRRRQRTNCAPRSPWSGPSSTPRCELPTLGRWRASRSARRWRSATGSQRSPTTSWCWRAPRTARSRSASRPSTPRAELEGTRVRFAERAAAGGRALRVDAPAGLRARRRPPAPAPGPRQPRRQCAAPR